MRPRSELRVALTAEEAVASIAVCHTKPNRPARLPKGLAFDIADLVLAKGWASFHNQTMSVRLDHGSDDEEYEEIIEIGRGTGSRTHFIIWNDGKTVFVQPMPGKIRKHNSVAEALEQIHLKKSVILTDITAAGWPL